MNNYSLTLCIAAQLVENIHHDGGTVLRSSRGGFDIEKILKFLEEKEINQLYIIGGGTPLLLQDTALRLSKMSASTPAGMTASMTVNCMDAVTSDTIRGSAPLSRRICQAHAASTIQ